MGKSLSECTWEKQSSLPAKLIEDYERGVRLDVIDNMSRSAGQSVHTLLPVTLPILTAPPDPKRARATIPVVPDTNTGYNDVASSKLGWV